MVFQLLLQQLLYVLLKVVDFRLQHFCLVSELQFVLPFSLPVLGLLDKKQIDFGYSIFGCILLLFIEHQSFFYCDVLSVDWG